MPERRAAAEACLLTFFTTYFPETFSLSWSSDHRRIVAVIEKAIREGGQVAFAMPRGSGKTCITERACLWAALLGLRQSVAIIGSDEDAAIKILSSIKAELEGNDLLLEDFPEAVYPIRRLERITHRANGQIYMAKPTFIRWTASEIVLPSIPGSKASGVVIQVAGLTGRIRGMKTTRPSDGRTVRPSLVILDDPQTDESARSLSQCATRESIVAGAVLGLAGPGQKITAIMPCTVIQQGDLADRLLDRKKHPAWQGFRTRMVDKWPENAELWEEYAKLRASGLQEGKGLAAATAFYAAHREAMDRGAQVAWPERFDADELSAIQNAWNRRLDDERTFFAEYQNEPPMDETGGAEIRSPDDIAKRTNGFSRCELPEYTQHVTLGVDIHDKLLYWVLMGWGPDFTGAVIDYGSWPDQRRGYFTMRAAQRTLRRAYPGTGVEGAIAAGLEDLLREQMSREMRRVDGATMSVGLGLVDSGYLPSIVYQVIRRLGMVASVLPSKGVSVRAADKPFAEYKLFPGDRPGFYWRVPSPKIRRDLRVVNIDTNFWKSFAHARFATALGDPGAVSIFGKNPSEHRLFGEHFVAETPVPNESRGRKVVEWKLPPAKPDNHYFDCLVGCLVAASMLGVALPGAEPQTPSKRRVIRFADALARR